MKTKQRPVKKTARKTAAYKYACSACGAVIEADPCGCGCGTPVELVCCGKKMNRKRAG